MKSLATFLFLCNVAKILLTGSALPYHDQNSSPQTPQCALILGNVTNRIVPPFYSHSIIFGDAATLKDVQAFKYYCTNNLITSLIEEENVEVST